MKMTLDEVKRLVSHYDDGKIGWADLSPHAYDLARRVIAAEMVVASLDAVIGEYDAHGHGSGLCYRIEAARSCVEIHKDDYR